MIKQIRNERPRLYLPADEEAPLYNLPRDINRRRILANIEADCEHYYKQRPWKNIPTKPHSKHPFHQLYITFYVGMQATALIENYAFAWCLTGNERWLARARQWLVAAANWPHGDEIEEHFYTANRYMQAFALALDLLDGVLTHAEKKTATKCLVGLMKRWWPDVDSNRQSVDGAHHAVVDNGHFGVAAIHLLGEHPEAEKWLNGVIDRFRHGIMPHGCDHDGQPGDGPSFWPWENLWMLQFADALKNVTGINLYQEFPHRLKRPLTWLRYHLAAPDHTNHQLYTPANTNILLGSQLDACSPALLRLAQDGGDRGLRQVALSDAKLGRLYRFGAGVKGSNAECMIAYGPYAYCYFDPTFKETKKNKTLVLSRKFTQTGYGDTGLLRSNWTHKGVVACVSGYKGDVAHGFAHLHIQWAGYPLLRTISALEAQPVSCGSLPVVGGQNEVVGLLGRLTRNRYWDRLTVNGVRTLQEYWIIRGREPVVLAALRRRPRGIRLGKENGIDFVRLNGRDSLQYPNEQYFNSSAGRLRMRFRLLKAIDPDRSQVLFNTGLLGPQVNNFSISFSQSNKLSFTVQSQRYTKVVVETEDKKLQVGRWYDLEAAWGGFNRRDGRPFIEITLNGIKQRCDDEAVFGELKEDSQGLQSRKDPRTFFISTNTTLSFGAAVQKPDSGIACDIDHIHLDCPKRQSMRVNFTDGLGPETGSGPMGWKLNPVELKTVDSQKVVLGGGKQQIVVQAIDPRANWRQETVSYAPSGLAAGSLKSFIPGSEEANTRVQVDTTENELILAFAAEPVDIIGDNKEFIVVAGKKKYCLNLANRGRNILHLR